MQKLPPGVSIFPTAYDPLDLVAGSIDPLGFLKGYLALADRFLPSFTTVTTVPRYLPMLCAGLKFAQKLYPPNWTAEAAKSRSRRLEVLRNFEKLWALGCGLAAETKGEPAVAGLRGYMRYVKPFLQANAARSDLSTGDFNLLSNQVRYGGIGTYTQMLHGCHFIDAATLNLRPMGEKLADCFPAMPGWQPERPNARLAKEALRDWGKQVCADTITKKEAKLIREGLNGAIEAERDDEVRWQCLLLLKLARAGATAEPECLAKMGELLNGSSNKSWAWTQLSAIVSIIAPFERLYQSLLFLFDELRAAATEELAGFQVLSLNKKSSAKAALVAAIESNRSLKANIERGGKVNAAVTLSIVQAMQESGITALADDVSSTGIADAAHALLRRHFAVQSGKFDRGQPKAPWIRLTNGTAHVTSQRYQLRRESHAKDWRAISPHPYRTWAAAQFIEQCQIQ
jgi:hypothetical protein